MVKIPKSLHSQPLHLASSPLSPLLVHSARWPAAPAPISHSRRRPQLLSHLPWPRLPAAAKPTTVSCSLDSSPPPMPSLLTSPSSAVLGRRARRPSSLRRPPSFPWQELRSAPADLGTRRGSKQRLLPQDRLTVSRELLSLTSPTDKQVRPSPNPLSSARMDSSLLTPACAVSPVSSSHSNSALRRLAVLSSPVDSSNPDVFTSCAPPRFAQPLRDVVHPVRHPTVPLHCAFFVLDEIAKLVNCVLLIAARC